eukprot:COSAG04_NODE_3367_length_2882_cov_1.729429_5_plen_168_part_00
MALFGGLMASLEQQAEAEEARQREINRVHALHAWVSGGGEAPEQQHVQEHVQEQEQQQQEQQQQEQEEEEQGQEEQGQEDEQEDEHDEEQEQEQPEVSDNSAAEDLVANSSRDELLEQESAEYIEAITGAEGEGPLCEMLKDGAVLCALINGIRGGERRTARALPSF